MEKQMDNDKINIFPLFHRTKCRPHVARYPPWSRWPRPVSALGGRGGDGGKKLFQCSFVLYFLSMTHKDNGEGFVVGADADIVCQCRFCCSTIGFCANAWPLSRNSLRSCFSLYDGTETVRFHFSYVVFSPLRQGNGWRSEVILCTNWTQRKRVIIWYCRIKYWQIRWEQHVRMDVPGQWGERNRGVKRIDSHSLAGQRYLYSDRTMFAHGMGCDPPLFYPKGSCFYLPPGAKGTKRSKSQWPWNGDKVIAGKTISR